MTPGSEGAGKRRAAFRSAGVLAVLLLACASASAQRGPANASLTPLVEVAQIQAGSELRAALEVRLPEGYHTNSDRPRDPSLIPTTLTFGELPEGITAK